MFICHLWLGYKIWLLNSTCKIYFSLLHLIFVGLFYMFSLGLFFKRFFLDVDHFSLYWICYNTTCFTFWFFGHGAYGISAPWPGIKPAHPAFEGEVLTTGPLGKFSYMFFELQAEHFSCSWEWTPKWPRFQPKLRISVPTTCSVFT